MGAPQISNPLINGLAWDYSAVEIRIPSLAGPQIFGDVKSINYKHSLKPGKARGTRAQVTGRSRGVYDAEGSIEVYKESWLPYLAVLAASNPTAGYMEIAFDIVVSYGTFEQPGPVQTDVLHLCRIQDDDETHTEGAEILTAKLSLDIMLLIKNGLMPLSPAQVLQ